MYPSWNVKGGLHEQKSTITSFGSPVIKQTTHISIPKDGKKLIVLGTKNVQRKIFGFED